LSAQVCRTDNGGTCHRKVYIYRIRSCNLSFLFNLFDFSNQRKRKKGPRQCETTTTATPKRRDARKLGSNGESSIQTPLSKLRPKEISGQGTSLVVDKGRDWDAKVTLQVSLRCFRSCCNIVGNRSIIVYVKKGRGKWCLREEVH